jgi:hypothetical protein
MLEMELLHLLVLTRFPPWLPEFIAPLHPKSDDIAGDFGDSMRTTQNKEPGSKSQQRQQAVIDQRKIRAILCP